MNNHDDAGGVEEREKENWWWRSTMCFGSANGPAGCSYHYGHQHWYLCHQHACCHDAGWWPQHLSQVIIVFVFLWCSESPQKCLMNNMFYCELQKCAEIIWKNVFHHILITKFGDRVGSIQFYFGFIYTFSQCTQGFCRGHCARLLQLALCAGAASSRSRNWLFVWGH